MTVQQPNSFRTGPDERGHFGIYGGRFVAETLMPLILDLENAYAAGQGRSEIQEGDGRASRDLCRPAVAALFRRAAYRSELLAGAKIYFKREELNHTGAHKVNNVLGQIMLAKRMGKTRIIAETGAGMHGVATATLCAKFGLPCIVYMGAVDVERQKPNVLRMKMLGAEVRPVESGSQHAQGRNERGAARLGDQCQPTRSIASARSPARILIRRWCAISSRSSAAKRASRCRRPKAGFPIR